MTTAASAAPAPRPARIVLPSLGDPRLPFAAILTLYVVAGSLWLGFNRSPLQIALTVGSACCLDMALHALLRRREMLVPLSAFISSLSLVLLLDYAHDPFLLFLPVFLTIGSKYLLTFRGAHVFNPSLFGVATTLVLSGGLISTAPAYQWNGTWSVSAFMVTAALALFVFRVGRGWLVGSFLLFYALQTGLRAYLMRHHLPPEMLFLGTLSSPSFYLFTFFMLTDPKTSPSTARGQVGLAFAIATVDLWLHTRESVYTFFYAAFLVASARFVWLHLRELTAAGPRHLVPRVTTLRAAAVLGAVALAGGTAYTHVLRPRVELTDVGFVLREVPPAHSGLGVRMDPASLDLVDPRLRHISKWLLSVGDAVAAGDVDADGLPDLLMTHPLAGARDRVALYLNRGAFRFRREPLPALAPLLADPRGQGLPSGALIVDYDGDGGRDLLVLTSFGRPRLLRNLLPESGRLAFRDVSLDAGLPAHTVSVAANAFDLDGDARLDLLLANVLPPYLRDYATPTRLNLLDLPEPAYPGDRRMLRFMHDSWHDAENGGGYVLLRSAGGRFERLDAVSAGMPETHWTLAIGTGDLNGDGRTDLYAANDFGPDDLYVNEGGRFRRIAGRLFGHVGRDTYKGMNSSVADLDRDGRLDVYVSNVHHPLQAEGSLLWMNRGADGDGTPHFRDEAAARGILNERRFGWGAGVGDLDNDGWLDVVQANGMVDDRLDRRDDGCPDYWYANHKLMQSGPEIHTYADRWADLRGRCIWPNERRRVYLNRGSGSRPQFVDVARVVGLERGENSRGVAFVDLDNNGRLDVVISNQHGPPTLLRNVPSERRAWLGVQLVGDGTRCPREALGSQVRVLVPGERVQLREAQAANGFSAQGDSRLHFGLGESPPPVVNVAVRWCGGEERRYRLRPGRYHTLRQAP